jgi:hypothetical protein
MNIQAPNRIVHTYVQHLVAEPERVFPLLCPVREADWIEGWDPLLVVSKTGVAEADCVFVTAAEPADAIWYVTRHESDAGLVEMLKITPGITACRLRIQLQATTGGCDATVTYMHTSWARPATTSSRDSPPSTTRDSCMTGKLGSMIIWCAAIRLHARTAEQPQEQSPGSCRGFVSYGITKRIRT